MARDLTKETGRNGRAAPPEAQHVELEAGYEPGLETERAAGPQAISGGGEPIRVPVINAGDAELLVRQARALMQAAAAERLGAKMVRAVWDAAQMLDPLTKIVMARVLVVMALVAACALTAYTLALTTGWERVATIALFLLFAAIITARLTRQQQ